MMGHVTEGHAFYKDLADGHRWAVVYWGSGKYNVHRLAHPDTWDGSELLATQKVAPERDTDVEATANQLLATVVTKLRRTVS